MIHKFAEAHFAVKQAVRLILALKASGSWSLQEDLNQWLSNTINVILNNSSLFLFLLLLQSSIQLPPPA